jgi:hypothetical protein
LEISGNRNDNSHFECEKVRKCSFLSKPGRGPQANTVANIG